MPNFTGPEGELSELYISEPEILERYVGNQLWSWGGNFYGSLGDDSTTSNDTPIQTISRGTNWKILSTGEDYTAAIKTNNSLWLWGRNEFGQLGFGDTTNRSSPVFMGAMEAPFTEQTNWCKVSCGAYHTAAIKTDGTLWTWGYNNEGQLGDNTTTSKSSPVQTVAGGKNWKEVSAGLTTTAAIKTDGTLWLWGRNIVGNLGDNTITAKSSPVQTIAGGTNWKQVACGVDSVAAIKTDGTLWLWGGNIDGQLGDGTVLSRSSPVQTIAGGTNWKQVACGFTTAVENHTAAIKTDGTLWLWGGNSEGQLGDGTTTNRSSPVQTSSGGTTWKQVSVNRFSSFAIKTDGTIWYWGLFVGGPTGPTTPTQAPFGGNNWKQISVGFGHRAAVTYKES
jgi:alpha-tubulin suppressor-like RCC1 family protein